MTQLKEFEEYVLGLDAEEWERLVQATKGIIVMIPSMFSRLTLLDIAITILREATSQSPEFAKFVKEEGLRF